MNDRMELIDGDKTKQIVKPGSICIVRHEGKFVPAIVNDVGIYKNMEVAYYVYLLKKNGKEMVFKEYSEVFKSMECIMRATKKKQLDCRKMFKELDIEIPE